MRRMFRSLRSWLADTDVEAAMRAVREMEKEEARVKGLLSLAKKALARAMLS